MHGDTVSLGFVATEGKEADYEDEERKYEHDAT